jgi:sugar diacid utilization regulator
LTIAIDPHSFAGVIVRFHKSRIEFGMSERATALVCHWGARLQENELAARVLVAVHERESDIQLCTLDGLQRENPAFQRAVSEQFRTEAVGHCHEISKLMFGIASGRIEAPGGDPFGFVRLHGIRRARQRFPLAGSLNAYRLAHKGYWTVMSDAVVHFAADEREVNACSMLLSEFLLEFFDAVSGTLTDAYLAEEARLIAQRTRARVALIDDLLHGRQPGDLEARELCERCGIRPGLYIAVALVRPFNSGSSDQAEGDEALHRLSRVIEESLALRGFGTLVDRRDGAVLAIAAGQSDTARALAKVLRACVTGRQDGATSFPVAAGIGLDVTEIAALPGAYQEAERALEFTEPRRPVVHFADVDLVELLLRRPDTAALRLVPEWAGRLREADAKSGDLSRTIHAFAECDLNVKRTARSLKLHTNTVYFRLNRVMKLTGVDPRSFSGASLLLTALRLHDAKVGGTGDRRGR